jgi:sulfur carrier protein ThiS
MDPRHTSRERALARTVTEIEQHVARRGWDAAVSVFALVRTAAALAGNPALADELPPGIVTAARQDAEHLTSIEQENLPHAVTLEDLLASIAWPETVDGTAVVVERVIVPPEAEAELPADPTEALAFLAAHPGREEVRIAAGVLRSGESWCALRLRRHDADEAVGGSVDAVPGLLGALRATLG